MNRHDMLVEMVSGMINNLENLAIAGNHLDLETWIAPILHDYYAREYANENDEFIAEMYEQETGAIPQGWEDAE
jgi:hypothetical protein